MKNYEEKLGEKKRKKKIKKEMIAKNIERLYKLAEIEEMGKN